MKCIDCENRNNCKDAKDLMLCGCTSGVPDNPIVKPCPFCGGKIHIIKSECLSNGFVSFALHHDMFSHAKCVLAGQTLGKLFETEEQAVQAWNKRV